MSHLIFCSFEVGGLPYKMAEILNRHGIRTYYISSDTNAGGHDSAEFHYGETAQEWDLSALLDRGHRRSRIDKRLLRYIKDKYSIDYCLATGHKSYLLKDAGIKYGYWSYGADLDQFRGGSLRDFCVERRRFIPAKGPFWKKIAAYIYLLSRFSKEQRMSINGADSVMIIDYQLRTYRDNFPPKKLFYTSHVINVPDYGDLRGEKERNGELICGQIGARRFFFSATRHLWSERNRAFADYKGNDVIVRSFARYLEISKDKTSKLILAVKGPDADLTKRLIKELGIENYVVWTDQMPKGRLLAYYQGASLCFGQFGLPMLSYAVLEPLANATPCISYVGNGKGAPELPFYGAPPPLFNSRDPEEIARFMHKVIADKSFSADISYKSWLWAKENCSEEKFVESVQGLAK